MGHKTDTVAFYGEDAEQQARDHQAAAKGQPGYSESYPKGAFPCKVIHPETGDEVDGWNLVVETYYG